MAYVFRLCNLSYRTERSDDPVSDQKIVIFRDSSIGFDREKRVILRDTSKAGSITEN